MLPRGGTWGPVQADAGGGRVPGAPRSPALVLNPRLLVSAGDLEPSEG